MAFGAYHSGLVPPCQLLLERSSRAVLRIIQSKSITGKVNLAWDENNGRISKSCYSLKLIN